MAIDDPAASRLDDLAQAPLSAIGEGSDDDISELVKQLGLSKEEARSAADLVMGKLAASSQGGVGAEEALPAAVLAERFDIGNLLQVVGGGQEAPREGKQKPDLAQLAQDELAKAVAKKLGIDFETAKPIVEALLGHVLGKQTTPRRRKPAQSGRKRPKAQGKPPASASSSTRPKRRKAKKPAASSASAGDKPAARKKRPRPSTGSGAASSGSTSKPARRKPKSSSSSGKRKKPGSQRPAASGSTSRPARPRRRPAARSAPQTEKPE